MSTLLCPRRVGALPAEVQRKTSRPERANTLTQFVCPAQLVLRKEPPVRGEPADAVRVPRSASAEKGCRPKRVNRLRGSDVPISRYRKKKRADV